MDDAHSNDLTQEPTQPIASVPISLQFPQENEEWLQQAAQAVRAELQLSRKWIRHNAIDVRLVQDNGTERLFAISVGQSVALDWSLEGTTALRPSLWNLRDPNATMIEAACDECAASHQSTDNPSRDSVSEVAASYATDNDDSESDVDANCWIGDVVSLDVDEGLVYVSVGPHGNPPVRGVFWLEPFAFLKSLNEIYSGEASIVTTRFLVRRIPVTCGGIHPRVPSGLLPEFLERDANSESESLAELWRHGWSLLWGPPGTGKTHLIAQEVAKTLAEPDSRVLIVSTTNKATDEVAIRIALAAKQQGHQIDEDTPIVRIGKSADVHQFKQHGVQSLLGEASLAIRERLMELRRKMDHARSARERAILAIQSRAAYADLDESAEESFFDPDNRIVACTAFSAISMLRIESCLPPLDDDRAPFTTVIVDEAGLVSRATIAALSLLAADRVWLVGDPRQLSPISKIERIISQAKSRWMSQSGLSHLTAADAEVSGVHLLDTQYRMHPDIAEVVSQFQYEGVLQTANAVRDRKWSIPKVLQDVPRAIWYVLDEEVPDRAKLRARRGAGNQSWDRELAISILDKLFSDATLRQCTGLFVTPFRFQVRLVDQYFREQGLTNWKASTVHSQQGGEADVVIFDTVNAGSYGWSEHEWKRLINVGISRARHAVIVFASRDEMREPYLSPLTHTLWPAVLNVRGATFTWRQVSVSSAEKQETSVVDPASLGGQLSQRQAMRPVMSNEQQRLCDLSLDGKPRLVRGVAGSGKTVVLAQWLVRTVSELIEVDPAASQVVWAVYANASLGGLLRDQVTEAWQRTHPASEFPWQRVRLRHLHDVLDELLRSQNLFLSTFEMDVNAAAQAYLTRVPNPQPLCWAMFIDESQDFGPEALRLLASLTEQTCDKDANSRNVNFFYDNAQNLYDRPMPKWVDVGVDLRGRSTVMQESFRSTHPLTEYALNVLYRLQDPQNDDEYRELVKRELVQPIELPSGEPWWRVRFNQVGGPPPRWKVFDHFAHEKTFLVQRLTDWVQVQQVCPSQICVIYNGKKAEEALRMDVAPSLRKSGILLNVQKREALRPDGRSILATTAHSFKGHDAELVVVFGVNGFALRASILHHALYVAMTRARSMLLVTGHSTEDVTINRLFAALSKCRRLLTEAMQTVMPMQRMELRQQLLQRLDPKYEDWLDGILNSFWEKFDLSPLALPGMDQPIDCLFQLDIDLFHWVCVEPNTLSTAHLDQLKKSHCSLLYPGDKLG